MGAVPNRSDRNPGGVTSWTDLTKYQGRDETPTQYNPRREETHEAHTPPKFLQTTHPRPFLFSAIGSPPRLTLILNAGPTTLLNEIAGACPSCLSFQCVGAHSFAYVQAWRGRRCPQMLPPETLQICRIYDPHPIRATSLCFCVVVLVVCFFDCVRHFWTQTGEICRLSQLFAPEILQGFPIFWGPPVPAPGLLGFYVFAFVPPLRLGRFARVCCPLGKSSLIPTVYTPDALGWIA